MDITKIFTPDQLAKLAGITQQNGGEKTNVDNAQKVVGQPSERDAIADAAERVSAAKSAADSAYQNMLNVAKSNAEKNRTDAAGRAKIDALGNFIHTMAQPIGWAIGGSTAPVPQYDNRAYLDSFNKAVKATEDLRNIGVKEQEYQFNMANADYNRALKELEGAKAAKMKDDAEAKTFERRAALAELQANKRVELADVQGKYKLQSILTRKSVGEDATTTFVKRAATAYNNYKADYLKRQAAGIEMKERLLTWEEYLGNEAEKAGFAVQRANDAVSEQTVTTQAPAAPAAKPAATGSKTGGFKTSANSGAQANGKKGGFKR